MKSEKPIEVGDLVVVVKNKRCCGHNRNLGLVFAVTEIADAWGQCMDCGDSRIEYITRLPHGKNMWVAVDLCRRIPPLGELREEKIVEEITA